MRWFQTTRLFLLKVCQNAVQDGSPVLFFLSLLTLKSASPLATLLWISMQAFLGKETCPSSDIRHIKPWGAWRQLHWLETSVPLISPRPPEPVQANGRTFRARLPTRHTHPRRICTPQFKGTRTSPADELMTWTELYWDSTNKSTALSLSSRLFFLSYVEWHAWFLTWSYFGGLSEYFKCHLTVYVVSRGLL